MPRFKVAHLREQGIDLVIVPLERSFGNRSSREQDDLIDELQRHVSAAGLAGTVVPVWDSGGGRMAFIAPTRWHPYFSGLSLNFVRANLNREVYW